jgi:quercetin dioxygenase-like cupin family protein
MSTITSARKARALAPADGDARWFLGNLAVVKLTGEETDGQFSLVEALAARGDMPPLHVHHRDDETFLIIDGEMSMYVGDAALRGGPGSIFFAPRDVPHAYRVESDTARWRVISSPPAFAEFVLETSMPARALTLPSEPPMISPDELNETAARYGIEILGPPGTLPMQPLER